MTIYFNILIDINEQTKQNKNHEGSMASEENERKKEAKSKAKERRQIDQRCNTAEDEAETIEKVAS